jgi:hypothetical protein
LGGEEDRGRDDRSVEDRVQQLAAEIATLIEGATADSRRDLRDLVSGVLRERAANLEEMATATAPATSAAFNPLGIGLPLLLVGVVLVFLFPPVGLLILFFAAVMLVWGLVAALRFR